MVASGQFAGGFGLHGLVTGIDRQMHSKSIFNPSISLAQLSRWVL